LAPDLHFPHVVHLKEIPGLPGHLVPAGPHYDDPWDEANGGDGLDGFNNLLPGRLAMKAAEARLG